MAFYSDTKEATFIKAGTQTINKTPIEDGQIIFNKDNKTISIDGGGLREEYGVSNELKQQIDANKNDILSNVNKLEFLKENDVSLKENNKIFKKEENIVYGANGGSSSSGHTSYTFICPENINCYFTEYDKQYTSICVYPNNQIPNDKYIRYRYAVGGENTLPINKENAISIKANSLIAITVSNNPTFSKFELVQNGFFAGFTLSPNVKINLDANKGYFYKFENKNLFISGYGIECNFNDNDFLSGHSLFELQDLKLNNQVIFGTNNDYIGPVRIHGESIKGGKHGSEITTTFKIITDDGEILDGSTGYTEQVTIIVESQIDNDFKRTSTYSFVNGKMVTTNTLISLRELYIDYIFGDGIISCQDDVNLAWINKEVLTQDVLIGLNESTLIITKKGTLNSHRINVNSSAGDQRVSFNVYSGRKKLYYYTCYGSNLKINIGQVFNSSCELEY